MDANEQRAWQNIETAEAEFLRNLADKGGLTGDVPMMLRHCAKLLTARPAPGQLEEQAEAWRAVFRTLSQVSPGWMFNENDEHRRGYQLACDAIRKLAALAQQVPADGEWVLVPRAFIAELDDQLIDLSNERMAKGHAYSDRERVYDADILQRLRTIAATPQAPQPVVDGVAARLMEQWARQADECEAMAKRLGKDGPMHMELMRDAAQYRQTIYQVGLILAEHEAASQPQQWAADSVLHPVYSPENFRFSTDTIGQQAVDELIAEMREWAHGEGCFNDDPEGEPLLCVYYSQRAFLSLCDRIEAAAHGKPNVPVKPGREATSA